MISCMTEDWSMCRDEIMAYWPQHWEELALDKAAVPLDPDVEAYENHAANGALHCVVVRQDGAVVGYHLTIVSTHLHYKSTLCGFTDIYWLRPDCRQGWTGVNMFKEVMRSLKARGVKKIYSGTKKHMDAGAIFERLGWTEAERLFSVAL